MEDYYCEERGEGFPILFLHGYMCDGGIFAAAAEHFAAGFRTVAVDLPGFGRTPSPKTAYCLDDYVAFVRRVISNVGGRAHVVAHSFGGRIAIKLAAECPRCVGKLALIGAAGMKPKRKPAYYLKVGTYKLLKRTAPSLAARFGERHASPDYLAAKGVMRESFVKIISENLEGCLGRISAPTLVIVGENDAETPPYMARRIADGIAGAALVTVKDAGHFCFLEKPRFVLSVLDEFLS